MNKTLITRNALMIILFCLLLCTISLNFLPKSNIAFYADDTTKPTITAESQTVHRGQTFNIDLTLSHNSGIKSLHFSVNYDSSAMTLKDVSRGDALKSLSFTMTNTHTALGYGITPFYFLWDGDHADTSEGVLVSLVFESKWDAIIGEHAILLDIDDKNTKSAYNTPVTVDTISATIAVTDAPFKVKYLNYDDTVLYEQEYNTGDVPTYPSDLPQPTREADSKYVYQFSDFVSILSPSADLLLYRATYEQTPKIYTVFFYVDGLNDSLIDRHYTSMEFYKYLSVNYAEDIDVSDLPTLAHYTFVGWFLDEECTIKLNITSMPDHNLHLYGYFEYNIRTQNIPQLKLSTSDLGDNKVGINVEVTQNVGGLNGMLLTLAMDYTQLHFVEYKDREIFEDFAFIINNTGDCIRLYWENATNSYQTGNLITLILSMDSQATAGAYPITFDYDEYSDITYINEHNEIWYSMLDIINTNVYIGSIKEWQTLCDDKTQMDVTCDTPMTANTYLVANTIPKIDYTVSQQDINALTRANQEIKSIYSIQLMQDLGDTTISVQPSGKLTIILNLTEEQKRFKNLNIYYVDAQGKLTYCPTTKTNDSISFETSHLSYWALVGNINNGDMDTSTIYMLIIFPILLSFTVMAYALILLSKNSKLIRKLNCRKKQTQEVNNGSNT